MLGGLRPFGHGARGIGEVEAGRGAGSPRRDHLWVRRDEAPDLHGEVRRSAQAAREGQVWGRCRPSGVLVPAGPALKWSEGPGGRCAGAAFPSPTCRPAPAGGPGPAGGGWVSARRCPGTSGENVASEGVNLGAAAAEPGSWEPCRRPRSHRRRVWL